MVVTAANIIASLGIRLGVVRVRVDDLIGDNVVLLKSVWIAQGDQWGM